MTREPIIYSSENSNRNLQKLKRADQIYVNNSKNPISNAVWLDICYATLLDKQVVFSKPISDKIIKLHIDKILSRAEELAWQRLDGLKHSDTEFIPEHYIHFKYKGKYILDPWVSPNAQTDPWVDHANTEQAVNPIEYYGAKKFADFVYSIISSTKII